MKIAIAVEADQHTVAVRMGHAPFFQIYAVKDETVTDLGVVENAHAGHHHGGHGHGQGAGHGHQHGRGVDPDEVQKHRRDLGAVKDCDAVLVRGVGPNMKAALKAEEVAIYRAAARHGETAEALAQTFVQSPESFTQL